MDHSITTRRSGRRWRRWASGLVGLALVAALGPSVPALADDGDPGPDPAPGHGDVPVWESPDGAAPVETTETESRSQRAARETGDALRLALDLLLDPSSQCNDLISGSSPAGGKRASEVLGILIQQWAAGNRLKFEDLFDFDRRDRDGDPILAYADGEGADGHITLYQAFHTAPYGEGYFGPLRNETVQPTLARYGGAPTPAEARAMVILHELAHLTGTLGQHTDGSAVDDAAFDLFITFQACLRKARLPESPADLPRDDDEDEANVGDELDDWFDEWLGDREPRDPGESDDPVLGDCCEEVDPGESEEPVLGGCCDEVDPGDGGDDPYDDGEYDDDDGGGDGGYDDYGGGGHDDDWGGGGDDPYDDDSGGGYARGGGGGCGDESGGCYYPEAYDMF